MNCVLHVDFWLMSFVFVYVSVMYELKRFWAKHRQI